VLERQRLAMTSSASRPSRSTSTGVPTVKPSTLVDNNMSASRCTPTSSRRSAIGKPTQVALPASSPPTSFETQVNVIRRSMGVRRSNWSQLSVTSRSTMPWMRRRQSSVVRRGTCSAVSMR
jgi:hypothetical protein